MVSPLQSLNIKAHYSTDDYYNNRFGLIQEFFIPCLKNSIKYDRISAFYSSYVLVYLFQGIKEFIRNNGKMRLILGCIPRREFQVLNDNERKKYYEQDFIQRLLDSSEIEEKKLKESILKLFAWMLDKKILEIKLGFIINNKGNLANKKEIMIALQNGMLHEKKGIFTDNKGFKIGFIGSLNETVKGYLNHIDSITTFKSWKIYNDETYNEHLMAIINEFEMLWHNRGKRLRVFSLPNETLKPIMKYLPDDFPEENYKIINNYYRNSNVKKKIKKNNFKINTKKEDNIKLNYQNPFNGINWYKPQIEGYEKWVKNGRKGILAIATGVGKTLIALRILYEFLIEDTKEAKLAIILVPDNLALQWKEELKKYIFNNKISNIGKLSLLISYKNSVSIDTKIVLLKRNLKFHKNNTIVIYYTTFIKKLLPIIQDLKNTKFLLIADEVHEIGTKRRREKLKDFNPDFRLGLSATPIRMFDHAGNNFIEDYFSGTVYEYSIKNAIEDGLLCKYNYYPIFYTLTEEELSNYNRLTTQIAIKIREIEETKNISEKKILKDEEKDLKIKRKRIIKLAQNKLPLLNDLLITLKQNEDIYKTLIYVEENSQLESVASILDDLDIRYEIIIQNVDPNERMRVINKFEEKQIQVIVAEKILDQGININSLKNGIILSSTVNKRQYIQRRGRLLRKHYTKDKANIYDFIILHKKIHGEIERAKIFFEDCDNKYEVLNRFLEKGINLEEY